MLLHYRVNFSSSSLDDLLPQLLETTSANCPLWACYALHSGSLRRWHIVWRSLASPTGGNLASWDSGDWYGRWFCSCGFSISRGPSHIGVQSARPSLESIFLEIQVWLCEVCCCCCICCDSIIAWPRADSIPTLWCWLHVISCLNLGQTTLQATIREDIEASIQLLGNSWMRNLLKRHFVESFIFSQGFCSCLLFSNVACFVPLLLVLLSVILVLEPRIVLNLHVDRIVHHSFVLDSYREFFDLVLAMYLSLGLELLLELSFLILINICNGDRIKFSRFPKSLGGLCLINFMVNLHLFIVVF